MRREIYRMDVDGALDLFRRAPVVRFASTLENGEPVLRTVHGVLVDSALAFHGTPAGEKAECVGRRAVLASEEIIAPIPSYWVDPERACPATTLYLGAQAHGVLEKVSDPDAKARVLAALMEKLQPEGGYEPLAATAPLYRGAVKGLLIVRVALERVEGKAKLLQNRTPAERGRILTELWKRGLPGDLRAIELVRDHNLETLPEFLQAPRETKLCVQLGEEDARAAAGLLRGTYWNAGLDEAQLVRAHLGASAWVGARDQDGALVGSARAISDGGKCAWIFDVIVSEHFRGRGVGKALLRLLLDHPRLRSARTVRLHTRDAQRLYAAAGFRDVRELPARPFTSTEMALLR